MAVEYIDGDYISDTHWLAMREAIKGNAIISGMAVTPNGTQPPLEVDIAAGIYYANKTRAVYAGGSEVLDAAHGTYDRWDIITGDAAGALTYTAGTAAAIPHPPDLPANETLITAVLVPATVTSIIAAMIHNMYFLSELLEHATRHENGGDDEVSILGLSGLAGDAQTPVVHGPAYHTDRTRYLLRGIGEFIALDADTPPALVQVSLGGVIQQYYKWLTGTDADYIWTTIRVPIDFDDAVGNRLEIIGCQEDAGAGDVVTNITVTRLRTGGVPVIGVAWSNTFTVSGVIGQTLFTDNATAESILAGDVLIVGIRREGTNLNDTFGGDWGFQGIRLVYNADE